MTLKALDTSGNIVKDQYSHFVYWGSIGHRIYKRIMKKKTFLHNGVWFQMHNKRLQLKYFLLEWEITFFKKQNKNATSEEAVSHNVLYYQ